MRSVAFERSAAARPAGADRPEGDPLDRDLVRTPDRGHEVAPGLPRALPGPGVAGRAPVVDAAPLSADPREARDELRRLRKHLRASDLFVVAITKDAEGLKAALVADEPSTVEYDAPKPELAEADRAYGEKKLGIRAEDVTITPVDDVFAK